MGVLVSVIVPAFNEEESILPVLDRIETALTSCLAHDDDFEVIVVDDGSVDNTYDLVNARTPSAGTLETIRFVRNFGHSAALAAGLRAASGSAIIVMDGDGQHPPELIPRMLAAWQEGAELVNMRRIDSASGWSMKRSLSFGFYRFFSLVTPISMEPGFSDFRLIDAAVLDQLLASPDATNFLRGAIAWLSPNRTVEITYEPEDRIAGCPSFSVGKSLRFALMGLATFSLRPVIIVSVAAAVVGIVSAGSGVYAVALSVLGDDAVPGWASLSAVLGIGFAFQAAISLMLASYLSVVRRNVGGMPQYVISQPSKNAPRGAKQE